MLTKKMWSGLWNIDVYNTEQKETTPIGFAAIHCDPKISQAHVTSDEPWSTKQSSQADGIKIQLWSTKKW